MKKKKQKKKNKNEKHKNENTFTRVEEKWKAKRRTSDVFQHWQDRLIFFFLLRYRNLGICSILESKSLIGDHLLPTKFWFKLWYRLTRFMRVKDKMRLRFTHTHTHTHTHTQKCHSHTRYQNYYHFSLVKRLSLSFSFFYIFKRHFNFLN